MFKEISTAEWNENVFTRIGKDWMLISAGNDDRVNAMTASWGGMGVLWNKQVVYIFVRPQRFTKTLIDASDHFAISFYQENQREMLAYMGKASGKDEDKIEHCKLHVSCDGAPYFEEAKEVMICRKLFAQQFTPESFSDVQIEQMNYPEKDYHIMYVGEIEKILVKQ